MVTADGWWEVAGLPAALGTPVRRGRRLTGGDVAEAFALDLDDGRTVFAKTHADPPAGMFTTEARSLRWLAEADALPVPTVLAVSDEAPAHLVLSWVDAAPGRLTTAGEEAFGRGLAALHRHGAPVFGREDGRTTGSLAMPNDPADSWPAFLAGRLHHLAGLADQPDIADGLHRLAERLPSLGLPEEPPARLHGDLWAGNRMVDEEGRSWLIDPAAFGGHREHDLAMMALFGGFGAACWHAYDEVHPLAEGWRDRVRLHQVLPLAVHAIRFGGGYVASTREAVAAHL